MNFNKIKTVGVIHSCKDGKNTLEGMWHLRIGEIRWHIVSYKYNYCPYCAEPLPKDMELEYTFLDTKKEQNETNT